MFHHTRGRAVTLLLLLCLWGGSARAQQYEVRTFLAPSEGNTDSTYQYLQSCIKERWVCPYCSFSRASAAPGTVCPNPWGLSGHPNVTLVDTAAFTSSAATGQTDVPLVATGNRLSQRLLSLALPVMSGVTGDLELPDPSGALQTRAVLGRPFKPLDNGNARRSSLHAAAAGLVNNSASDGPVISDSMHGRFLVIPPSGYRRELPQGSSEVANVPARRVMAQPDPGTTLGGDDNFRPQVRATNSTTIAAADLGNYLHIGLNPYRVDEGDYWFVRYTERHSVVTPANVDEATVEIYSIAYGWDGDVDSSNAPVVLTITGGVTFPFSVVSASGAVRLTFVQNWAPNGANNTWTVGFMSRSTCRLVPGCRDMAKTAGSDPAYYSLFATGLQGDTAFNLLTDTFPGPKRCSFDISSSTPNFTTETDIEEGATVGAAGKAFPIILPADTIGQGTIAVQWAGDQAGDWTLGASNTWYVDGGAWQYDAHFNPNTEISNADVVNQTDSFGTAALGYYVKLAASRFMVTSLDAVPTGLQWQPDTTTGGATNVERGLVADWYYPRAVIGELNGGVITGSYAPGSITPPRQVGIVNRWDGTAAVRTCATCGAVLPASATVCPYHSVDTAAVTTVTATGAGDATYNDTYSIAAGTYGGQPTYQGSKGRWIYWLGGRWVMGPNVPPPGGGVTYRGAVGAALGTGAWTTQPAGTDPPPTVTASGGLLAPQDGGAFTVSHDSWREAACYSIDEVAGSAATVRQTMAASAFRAAGPTIPHSANYGAAVVDQLSASIPRYQAPSVPGTGAANTLSDDRGYRGGQVLHQNLTAPNTTSGLTSGWDCFYRNPDLGCYQPAPGVWPFLCPHGEIQWAKAAGPCPVHPTETLVAIGGPHYVCSVCGSEFVSPPTGGCPFDGKAVTVQIPITEAVREEHLMAENFDPVDLQVSVNRQTEFAQATPAVAIGRLSPGVAPRQPDTNAGVLTAHDAFPAYQSPLPRAAYAPSDARVVVSNEGNIRLAPAISGSYQPLAGALADLGVDHYLRLDVDPYEFTYARKGQSVPLTRDTFFPLYAPPGATSYSAGESWQSLVAAAGEAAPPASGGYLLAGQGRKPVPLGQPAGTYTGAQLQYVDANASGDFDFQYYDGSAWQDTTTADRHYNPAQDRPLEPLTAVLQGQARVFESRMPQSDFYAADTDPVVLPSLTPGVLQVIWATNRPSTATGASNPGAAGTTPADLPDSNAGVNLVYVTTGSPAYGGAGDELYRRYPWPTDGSGVLTAPAVITNNAAGTANGAPAALLANDGGRWVFWHRALRHAGGVESTLRYLGPSGQGYIYDTGLPKQGLRGFFPPGSGAWLFWHSGNPGRERLMYRWNFDGTTTHNEAYLPVTNQVGSGELSDLVTATLPDGTTGVIRRPSGAPFTYTKDVAVTYRNDTVNVFFSGFVTHEGQADICQTRFRLSGLGPAKATDNYAKLPYGRVTAWEEMQPEALHQRFGSRHLDWLVDRDFATSGTSAVAAPTVIINPDLRLELAFDALGDGVAPDVLRFDIDWSEGSYDRARGLYTVVPRFYGLTQDLGVNFRITPSSGSGYYLIDPNSPAGNLRPLKMEINVAAGTVRFASPLFNEDAPADRTAALRSTYIYNGHPLVDVVLRANYTPYVYRVTRDAAQDDAPSAFYDGTTTNVQRLTCFWRRSYPTTDAPHFGRPAFMYKVYTTSVQVGRPPISGTPTVTDYAGGAAVPVTVDADPGILTVSTAYSGHYLRVAYQGADGAAHVERHQVIGWSREMLVPVATVVGEGSPVAVPELYSIPSVEGGAGSAITAVRYWLFWASPRGVYDLRLTEGPKGRVAPYTGTTYDLPVHPSSDIYTAVVAPEFGGLAPERDVDTINNNPT